MEQQQQKMSEYQAKSAFTLVVYFKNQTGSRKMHSWKQDYRKVAGREIRDERYSINRLVHLVENVYEGKYKTAMIFHNASNKQIFLWAYGVLKSRANFEFQYTSEGNCLFAMKEENLPKTDKERENFRKLVMSDHSRMRV